MLKKYINEIHGMMKQALGQFGEIETIVDDDWNVITILLDGVIAVRFYHNIKDIYINFEHLEETCDGLSYELMSVIGSICDLLYLVKYNRRRY